MRGLLFRAILPGLLIELLARLAGWLVDIVAADKGLTAECRIRAILFGLKYNYKAKDLGRGVTISKPSRLTLESKTSLRHGVVIMCGPAGVTIGQGSHVSHNSVFAASGGLSIGQDCGISSGVIIYTVDHDHSDGLPLAQCPVHQAPVTIGNGVHIGANVTILPGVTIGDNAIIGAGAVVTKDVGTDTTVAGVPAKILRDTL